MKVLMLAGITRPRYVLTEKAYALLDQEDEQPTLGSQAATLGAVASSIGPRKEDR